MRTRTIRTVICLACAFLAGLAAYARGAEENDDLYSAIEAELSDLARGALAEAVTVPVSSSAKLKWTRKVVGRGYWSSIAIDPAGRPHIAFGKESGGTVVQTHSWFDGTRWNSETIDTNVGYDNAIAIDHGGGIHIAYAAEVVGEGWSLKYAHSNGFGWTTEKVEKIEPGGLSNSIVTDADNLPHIVHIDNAGNVRYLRWSPPGWAGETIATNGFSFGGTSLILHNGSLYATYSEGSLPRQLFLATNETGAWTSAKIDDGRAGSAAFAAAGTLHVVYAESANNELRHAWFTGAGWQKETLVSSTSLFGVPLPAGFQAIGDSPSLAADTDGRLHLSFGLYVSRGEAYAEFLIYAVHEGGAWADGSIVASPRTGYDSSLAVAPNGIPHIVSRKALPREQSAIVTFGLRGKKLSLLVRPKVSGTVQISPTGEICSGRCKEDFFPGTTVTLTAVPAEGQSFIGWSGACTGNNPVCTVTMNRFRSVVARFKALLGTLPVTK